MRLGLGIVVALLAPQLGFAQLPGAPADLGRLVVYPESRQVAAGDTVRLRLEAYDRSGSLIPNATFRYQQIGSFFEASVDPTGLIRAVSTGTLPVGVYVILPGAQPYPVRVDIEMVPGPAKRVEITPRATRLVVGQRSMLEASAYSEMGDKTKDGIAWRSSAPNIIAVDSIGRIRALAPGRATVTATVRDVSSQVGLEVISAQIGSIEITPSSTQARQGDVIRFAVTPKDERGRPIEGVTPTFSISPGDGMIDGDGAFVGYRPGDYVITASFGDHSADAIVTLTNRNARRPLTVLGRVPRTQFSTEEVWVHPNGEVAYLGSGSGGDRLYVIDIRDPEKPVVVDSMMADTRRVNDVMTTPDGRVLVHTRENASSRQNGIVIATLEDPMHPKKVAEFTNGVTAGVHSAFIYQQPQYGTHVYLTNNGTNTMHVVDISDPANPREVGRWRSPSPDAGGSLHDIDIQDGLAYLSYWNDNLIVLDVGNGVKGGSPSNPQFVMQYKYDLNEMYRNVAIDGGPGFIRGTHTAWRNGDYVFIADEVFQSEPQVGTKDASATRAYGNLQVIDVSDWEHPRPVAWYSPEDGGVHNIWIENDILYMGAYTSGFRVFDISGELRGDLRAQGREVAHLDTADMDGHVPNQAMTWGVVVKNGLAYINDMHNGLWIVRVEWDAAEGR
jgi:hypothetical protein